MNKFKTKNGLLNPYALICGYVEQYEHNNIQVTLWREHGVYHVRSHDFNTRGRLMWSSFDKLTEARKVYAKECRSIK